MTKRIISTLLILACVLSFPMGTVHAEEEAYQIAEIVVDSFGNQYTERVLVDEGGTIFAPISWFPKYGWMECMEESDRYVFYYPGEKTVKPFAKRIYIDMNGREVSCGCYVTETKFKTYLTHEFTQSVMSDKTIYLPVAEMLPLFNAKIEITDDGILHINANAVSVFSALYGWNLQKVAFDADRDIVGHKFISATGMLVDSILGIRIDRLDGMWDTGEITDYKKLFKAYLVDDEAFLSAYDEEKTPTEKAMETSRNALKEAKEFLKDGKFMPDFVAYALDSEVYQGFKDFKDIYSGISDAAEGIYKIADYSNTYINQVDDHVNMLKAVYNTDFFGEGNPAYKAATQIVSTYGTDSAKQRKEIVRSTLHDYAYKKFKGAAVKELGLTPYKIAFSAVKLALPDAVEIMEDAAKLGYMDDVVKNACKVFDRRTQNMQFDAESLDELRLTAMLALVASRHAYTTYWEEDEMTEEKKKVNEALTGIYLAAEGVKCESAEYYGKMLSKLNSRVSTLEVKITGTAAFSMWRNVEELVAAHRYWDWGQNVENSSRYVMKLYEDGTLMAFVPAIHGRMLTSYEWSYENGVLSFAGDDFYWNGTDFVSENTHILWNNEHHPWRLSTDSEGIHEEAFEEAYKSLMEEGIPTPYVAPSQEQATPTPYVAPSQDQEASTRWKNAEELLSEYQYWNCQWGGNSSTWSLFKLYSDGTGESIEHDSDGDFIGGVYWSYESGVLNFAGADHFWNGTCFETSREDYPDFTYRLYPDTDGKLKAEFESEYSRIKNSQQQATPNPTTNWDVEVSEDNLALLSEEEMEWFAEEFRYTDYGFIDIMDEAGPPDSWGTFYGYMIPWTAQYSDEHCNVLVRIMKKRLEYITADFVQGLEVGHWLVLEYTEGRIQSIYWDDSERCYYIDVDGTEVVFVEQPDGTFDYDEPAYIEYGERGMLAWIPLTRKTLFGGNFYPLVDAGQVDNFYREYIEFYDDWYLEFVLQDDMCTFMSEKGFFDWR